MAPKTEEEDMPQDLPLLGESGLSIGSLFFNLAAGLPLAFLITWHFRRFGSTLSNRDEFSQVFPFVMLTTILIISVVKSSLALSLGLVGALSIVRFRTPIKEPEELAYLFLAIAMGLGLGASQTLPTVIAGPAILGVMAVFKWTRAKKDNKNLYLSVDWQGQEDGLAERYLSKLNDLIGKHVLNVDLRRFDIRGDTVEATYFIDIPNGDSLSDLVDELRQNFPAIGVTFLDQNQLPSV